MQFISPNDKPLTIALLSGHTCVINPEATEVPERFHREAIARGCKIVGVSDTPEIQNEKEFDRFEVVKAAIQKMLDSSDPTYFNGDGKPSVTVLCKEVGFSLDRFERDRVWDAIVSELGQPKKPGGELEAAAGKTLK